MKLVVAFLALALFHHIESGEVSEECKTTLSDLKTCVMDAFGGQAAVEAKMKEMQDKMAGFQEKASQLIPRISECLTENGCVDVTEKLEKMLQAKSRKKEVHMCRMGVYENDIQPALEECAGISLPNPKFLMGMKMKKLFKKMSGRPPKKMMKELMGACEFPAIPAVIECVKSAKEEVFAGDMPKIDKAELREKLVAMGGCLKDTDRSCLLSARTDICDCASSEVLPNEDIQQAMEGCGDSSEESEESSESSEEESGSGSDEDDDDESEEEGQLQEMYDKFCKGKPPGFPGGPPGKKGSF